MQSPSNFVVPQLLPTYLQQPAAGQLLGNQPSTIGQLKPQLFPEFTTTSTSIPVQTATTTGSAVEVKPVESALPVVKVDLGHSLSTGVLPPPPKKKYV